MSKLEDKLALITGASSGIGEACAEELAAQGCRLILAGRRKERLKEISARLAKQYQTECLELSFDIMDREKIDEALENLPGNWHNIQILINNAGLALGADKLQAADISHWESMIDTNIKGLLYMSRAIIPGMVERQEGHIVNIGSTAGHEVYPGGSVYCATKHAVGALTKGMRIDLVDTPLRVSTVDPGMVDTEFSTVRFHGDKKRADEVYKNMTPLCAKDIAETVAFVLSRPAHVQIAEVIVLPTAQATATMVHRVED